MEAMQKIVDRIEKGVNFCNDCVKQGCKFRGIAWDCDVKLLSSVQTHQTVEAKDIEKAEK